MLLRSIFLTLLLLASSTAQAWQIIYTFSNSKVYVNPESFSVSGQTRSFWTMENFSSRQSDGAMQRRKQYEVDCNRMKIRVLRWVNWSEHGSDLTTVIDRGGPENSHRWYDVQNNNRELGGQLYQYACR
jgi:hypothetical protein